MVSIRDMKEYQAKSGKAVGWSHILPQVPEVGIGNIVCEGEVCDENNDSDRHNDSDELLSPLKEQPISLPVLRERCEKVKRKLQLDVDGILEAEESTRGQSDNSSWYSLRKYRITASQCHRVATLRESTSPTKAIREVLMMNSQFQSRSMKEGIEMEDEILKDYVDSMQQKGHIGICVSKCGFYISKDRGFLGASPDGLVVDPSVSDSRGLVEVKYIQLVEPETLDESMLRKRICVRNDKIALNTKHKYFYQVQQQMYVTGRQWTDFVVKGSNSNEIFCQRVGFSSVFWKEIIFKLELFFDRWIAPEVAYPRIKHGLSKFDIRSE